MSPADIQSATSQHLPGITSVVLVLCIAYYLAKLIWLLVPAGSSDDLVIAADAAASGGRGTSSVDYEAIVNAHVFGKNTGEIKPPAQETLNAPDTRLNLKLRGAIAADDDTVAHAIIAESNGNERVFFLNDSVPGGAVLHEVHADRVILNRGGVLETLRLPKKSTGTMASIPRPTAQPSRPARTSAPPSAAGAGASSFTDILRPQPFMPNGQFKGYRVYPGRDRKKFAALGLRAGDLVTEINGQRLNNLNDAMEIFRNLGDTSSLSLVVERNDQPLVLELDTSQFMGNGPQ